MPRRGPSGTPAPDLPALKARLLAGLRRYPRGLSKTELHEKVFGKALPPKVLPVILRELADAGQIRVSTVTAYRRVPYKRTVVELVDPGDTTNPNHPAGAAP